MRRILTGFGLAGLCAAMLGSPALAQTAAPDEATRIAAIEAIIDAIATEGGVLTHAAKLSAANDLSGAASALEAYLIGDEQSAAVRGAYAVMLCRLDDRAAGKFEGAKLVAMQAATDIIATVTAACGALPDPGKLALGGELPQ